MNFTNHIFRIGRVATYATVITLLASCLPEFLTYEESVELRKKYYFNSLMLDTIHNPSLKNNVYFNLDDSTNIYAILPNEARTDSLIPTFDLKSGYVFIDGKKIISGETVVDFSKKASWHIGRDNYLFNIFNIQLLPHTGLPTIEINVLGNETINDRSTWKTAICKVMNDGICELSDTIEIKGRGNASWGFPKKGYNIKLGKKSSLIGMPKNKRWCLIANYRDRTRMRNQITFELGKLASGIEWTPNQEYVELFINGQHQGQYSICEQIRLGKHRVDIDEMTVEDINEPNVTGGYLLEVDGYFDETNKFLTNINGWKFNIKEPDDEILCPIQYNYIKDYINDIEARLKNMNKDSLTVNDIDYESFIDYYLVEVFSGNKDFEKMYSLYFYKKRDGKLYAGPLWDFDYLSYTSPTKKPVSTNVFYVYLLRNEEFCNRVKKRWNELSPIWKEHIYSYIDETYGIIMKSEKINQELWPNNNLVNQDEILSFAAAVERLKQNIDLRFQYLDDYYKE